MLDESKKSVVKPLTKDEISYYVFKQAKFYPGFVRLYEPNDFIKKQYEGFEARDGLDFGSSSNVIKTDEQYETDLERSLRRTRQKIKDLVLCNDFEMFCTLTIKSDRFNIEQSKKKLFYWLKNQRCRNGKFDYILVPEFHKDKKALHFHALFKNYTGKIEESINPKTGRKFKKAKYHFVEYKSGFSDVKMIDKNESSLSRVAYYLQKYLKKDMVVFFRQNRYWVSRGLNRPVTIDDPQPWHELSKPDAVYANDFGKFSEFKLGNHPIIDMFIESNSGRI